MNGDDPKNAQAILNLLTREVERNQGAQFKAFVLFTPEDATVKKLTMPKANNVGVALLEGEAMEAWKLYKINPKVKNTVLVYKNRTVARNFVNFDASQDSGKLEAAIAEVCK